MTEELAYVMRRLYVTLALVAFALLAAWALGGSRSLSWAVLVLALVMIAAGLTWARRIRRRGEEPSWSLVFLGGGLACLALAREARPIIAIPLLVAGAIFLLLTGRAFRRDVRQAQAILDEAERAVEMRPPDPSP
jgi:hypothetical protein